MKVNEVRETKTIEELVKIEYIAEDGTVFRSEEECKKYEESALFAISKELKRLTKDNTSQSEINDNLSDEDMVEIFDVQTERDPEIYGSIFVKNGRNYYIADVEWETIFAYGRRGISINVYESNDIMQHRLYIEEIKSIITATNYQRFKKRVENEIRKVIELWEK